MTWLTRDAVAASTSDLALITRDTVVLDTPAAAATSAMVVRIRVLSVESWLGPVGAWRVPVRVPEPVPEHLTRVTPVTSRASPKLFRKSCTPVVVEGRISVAAQQNYCVFRP